MPNVLSRSRSPTLLRSRAHDSRRYAPVQSINIKPNPRNSPDPAVQREAEGDKVLKALDPRDLVVVLDERGSEVRVCTASDVCWRAG
jgi:23S rRNA (pseudouridine1915-N3)-methyltransferase